MGDVVDVFDRHDPPPPGPPQLTRQNAIGQNEAQMLVALAQDNPNIAPQRGENGNRFGQRNVLPPTTQDLNALLLAFNRAVQDRLHHCGLARTFVIDNYHLEIYGRINYLRPIQDMLTRGEHQFDVLVGIVIENATTFVLEYVLTWVRARALAAII